VDLVAAGVRGLVLMVALVLSAAEASAREGLDRAPRRRVGSALDRGPSQVQVWFDGEIEPDFSTIRVENDDKQRVDKGDARVNPGNTRLLEVTTDPLPSGRYRVFWSVIARDGHRSEGDFRFRVK
jgi:methionine-rich copper-binding protein CopC